MYNILSTISNNKNYFRIDGIFEKSKILDMYEVKVIDFILYTIL